MCARNGTHISLSNISFIFNRRRNAHISDYGQLRGSHIHVFLLSNRPPRGEGTAGQAKILEEDHHFNTDGKTAQFCAFTPSHPFAQVTVTDEFFIPDAIHHPNASLSKRI